MRTRPYKNEFGVYENEWFYIKLRLVLELRDNLTRNDLLDWTGEATRARRSDGEIGAEEET